MQAKPPKRSSGLESGVYEGVTFARHKLGEKLRRRRVLRLVLLGALSVSGLAVILTMALASVKEPHNSAWLWRPELYFGNEGGRRLQKVARAWDVRTLYLQVHHDDLQLRNAKELDSLIEAAHKAGIEVQALAGAPEWGDPRQLKFPLSLIDAVSAFNKESSQDFSGVHFDIEPYQLPLYALDPNKVMQNYLAVVSSISNRARDQKIFVAYSFPFFLNQPLEFRGESLPVYQHIMRRSDGTALMAYRTKMDGPNGFKALTKEVRDFAGSSRHVARTFLGIELTTGTAKTMRFLTAMEPPPNPERIPLEWEGHSVRLLHPGGVYLLGLAPLNAASGPASSATLSALAASVGFPTTAEEEVLTRAEREVRTTGEYGDIKQVPGGTAFGKALTLIQCTELLSQNVSFAGRSEKDVREFTEQVTRELAHPPKVMGVAYHDFEALDKLTDE